MRHTRIFPFVLLVATTATAQVPEPRSSNAPKATLLLGFGNSLGWLGLQAEGYFAAGRASVFGGLGYTPEVDRSWSGVAVAGGARLFTSRKTHRFFVEASVSQLRVEKPSDASQPRGDERIYGPGLQVGYQLMKAGGFTFMLSVGVGHTIDRPSHLQGTAGLASVGLGYTWRGR